MHSSGVDVPVLRCRAFFEGRYAELDAELFFKHREAFPRDVFTQDAFLWAVATVRSRVHSPLDGDYVALVPLADLVSRAHATRHKRTNKAWHPPVWTRSTINPARMQMRRLWPRKVQHVKPLDGALEVAL